jgi:Helix-turn-helix domain
VTRACGLSEKDTCHFLQVPLMAKRNTVAKIGKHVVTFDGDSDTGARPLTSNQPRQVAGEGSQSAREPPLEPLLTVEDVAETLRVSTSALNKWRVLGRGPRFIRVGACVRYRASDVAAFVRLHTRLSTSSSEAPAA